MSKYYYRVLTIAGSDSGGGAGIQADLKTFSALNCFGMTAITALTAQNTCGVQSIFPVTPQFVSEQINAVISDIGVDAIKIGMLNHADIIHAVVSSIKNVTCPIVVDPVMFSKNGCALLSTDAIQTLCEQLLPLATIVTPNIPEAEHLAGIKIQNQYDMKNAALKIKHYGAQNILIKGGHLASNYCVDILYHNGLVTKYSNKRIETKNTHGTGCTLSAAIAAELAKGNSIESAVAHAKDFLTKAIISGSNYSTGKGFGPVDHLI